MAIFAFAAPGHGLFSGSPTKAFKKKRGRKSSSSSSGGSGIGSDLAIIGVLGAAVLGYLYLSGSQGSTG
jgi:hypothetical protein